MLQLVVRHLMLQRHMISDRECTENDSSRAVSGQYNIACCGKRGSIQRRQLFTEQSRENKQQSKL